MNVDVRRAPAADGGDDRSTGVRSGADGRDDDADDGGPDGSGSEVDADFRAMLAGIRTTLPGSQVLLAFLLTVPLQAGFGELGSAGRTAYLVALIATALASVLLIAPTAHARVRFPVSGLRRRTHRHVRIGAWLALAGTVALAVALAAATFLSVVLLLGVGWAAVVTAGIAGVVAVTWFGLPIWWTVRGD